MEFGFVAALEREVAGLVRDWTPNEVGTAEEPRRIYCHENAALICGGTGVAQARAAAKLLIEKYSPRVIISIGFAGSCVMTLQPGAVVVPAALLDAATGKTIDCSFGHGRMVTLDRVAGKALKREAYGRFSALAVEMEAAGVAEAAAERGIEFGAIKVISDGADEDLGFLSDFVTPEGFDTKGFLAHVALRPGLWGSVAALQRNSKLATAALERAVGECIGDWQGFSAKYSNIEMKESF